MKKFLAIIMVVAMMASLATVAFAEDAPKPVASYDFTGGKMKDTTGNNADLTIEEDFSKVAAENAEETLWPNVTDDSGVTNYVKATDKGLVIANAYVKLPAIFEKVDESSITGLTVSMTLNKMPDKWSQNEWSENLFSFASAWTSNEGTSDDNDPKRAEASFYCSDNGNVGTARIPYQGQGNWLDGSLNGLLKGDENKYHNVTVTYDIASNKAVMYFDGEMQKESGEWETKCSLTAAQIKTLTANALGFHTGGNWGNWGFYTVANFSVYTSSLTADQVKTVATTAIGTLNDAPATPPATEGNKPGEGGNPPAPQTGFATVALAVAAIGSGAYIVSKKRH